MRQNLLVGLLFSYSSVIEITVQRTEYIESLSRFPILVLILRKPLNEKEGKKCIFLTEKAIDRDIKSHFSPYSWLFGLILAR